MDFAITTTQSSDRIDTNMACFIEETGLSYIPRQKQGLAKIVARHGLQGIIVWERSGPVLYIENEKFFFHPNMAMCRISAYRKKAQPDLMIKACQLTKGDSFLDCTLGLGADAIVAAYFSEYGKIIGLESQGVVAAVIGWGMKLYQGNMPWLNQAIKKIQVINSNHRDYLSQQPEASYDIVYFDPMFTRPLRKSQPLEPLRKIANYDQLHKQTIMEACRVARKSVVMKSLRQGEDIARLGFTEVVGSRHNPIAYGVIKL